MHAQNLYVTLLSKELACTHEQGSQVGCSSAMPQLIKIVFPNHVQFLWHNLQLIYHFVHQIISSIGWTPVRSLWTPLWVLIAEPFVEKSCSRNCSFGAKHVGNRNQEYWKFKVRQTRNCGLPNSVNWSHTNIKHRVYQHENI